jgi:hypothetical protein
VVRFIDILRFRTRAFLRLDDGRPSPRLRAATPVMLPMRAILTAALAVAVLTPSPFQSQVPRGVPKLETLLHTAGPPWTHSQSQHFDIYLERGNGSADRSGMLDSLEAAWRHAVDLVGPVRGEPRANVFVTASRTRFAPMMSPQNRGLTTGAPDGKDFIIIIHNDSVRAYTRHEVMHLVTGRAWGREVPTALWLTEGIATFADGRCQNTTIYAVARDILDGSPKLTVKDMTLRFGDMMIADRLRAYVLAATLVGYVMDTRGPDVVKAVWQGRATMDSLPTQKQSLFNEDVDRGWREYVRRKAGSERGIDSLSLRRHACG